LERVNAHLYETGAMRRVHLRGHTNILKRLLIHVGALNLGRMVCGVGTPRGLQGKANAQIESAALFVFGMGLVAMARRVAAPGVRGNFHVHGNAY
jgi:transposase